MRGSKSIPNTLNYACNYLVLIKKSLMESGIPYHGKFPHVSFYFVNQPNAFIRTFTTIQLDDLHSRITVNQPAVRFLNSCII